MTTPSSNDPHGQSLGLSLGLSPDRRTERDAQEEAQQEKRIAAVLHEMTQHGENLATWANRLATMLLAVFSTASLLSLSLAAFNAFMAQLAHSSLDIPDALSVLLNLLLVLAMDMAMFYAASVIRAILSAGGATREIALHVAVMATASILETSTYIYLVVQYDRPTNPWLWAIGIGRGIAAPLFATYLSLARKLPVAPRDIAYYVALLSGQGVVTDVARLAGDRTASLSRKVDIYTASATMIAAERQKFNNIITAVSKRQEDPAPAPAPAPAPEEGKPEEAPAQLPTPPRRIAPPQPPSRRREEPPAYAPAASTTASTAAAARKTTRTAARNTRRGLGRTGLEALSNSPSEPAAGEEPAPELPDRMTLRQRREEAARRILTEEPDMMPATLARRIAIATQNRCGESTARELRNLILAEMEEMQASARPPLRIVTDDEERDGEEAMREN